MRAKSSVKIKSSLNSKIFYPSIDSNNQQYDQQSTQIPSQFSSQQSLPKIIKLPQLSCRAWGIYNEHDGQLIKGLNTTRIREMASITKIMTCLVSLRLLKKYNFNSKKLYFSVSNQASTSTGTTANLKYNEWYTVNDLLYGLMLPSGNDCAISLAENFGCILYFAKQGQFKMLEGIDSVDVLDDYYVGTYVQLFVKEMNNIAQEFKLKSTKFTNPHGLSDKMNRSTCNDLAFITQKALQQHEFRKIVQAKYHVAYYKKLSIQNQQEYKNEWVNTNKLLDKGNYFGVKTGITNSAGSCLSSLYCDYIKEINQDVNIIIVVLGSFKADGRFDDTESIVEWYIKQLKDGSI